MGQNWRQDRPLSSTVYLPQPRLRNDHPQIKVVDVPVLKKPCGLQFGLNLVKSTISQFKSEPNQNPSNGLSTHN